VQDPIETKIHPQRRLRMQSSSQAGESSSTQLLKCRVRGNPRTHVNSNAEGRQRGKPSGETREVDLKSKPTTKPREQRTGATWGAEPRHCRRSRRSREIWRKLVRNATARARKRGNPKIQTRYRGRVDDSRRLDDPPVGITGRLWKAGRPAEPIERPTGSEDSGRLGALTRGKP